MHRMNREQFFAATASMDEDRSRTRDAAPHVAPDEVLDQVQE